MPKISDRNKRRRLTCTACKRKIVRKGIWIMGKGWRHEECQDTGSIRLKRKKLGKLITMPKHKHNKLSQDLARRKYNP